MKEIFYNICWNQNIGHGCGTYMDLGTHDYQTAKFCWKKMCKNKLPTEVNNVRVSIKVGNKGKSYHFDPNGEWPRRPMIESNINYTGKMLIDVIKKHNNLLL